MRSERRARRLERFATAQESAHDPRSGKPHKPLAMILSKYTVTASGCWEWTGSRNLQGYGNVCLMVDGKPKIYNASRLQWMHCNGPLPDDMDVCHSCDNPPCINPGHLWAGTTKANIHDMIAKGRHNFGGLKYSGESAQETAQARLSPENT